MFEGLIGLGAGPWKGPVNGLKSIKLNGTPIEDEMGSANFEDFTVIFADGDPILYPQETQLRLGASGVPSSVGLQVSNPNTNGSPGPWVVKSIANTNADFLDFRFIVQQLYQQSEDGIFELNANLEIEVKPAGASNWINCQVVPAATYDPAGAPWEDGSGIEWFTLARKYPSGTYNPYPNTSFNIYGKTTSAYVYEVRIQVPNTGGYANKGWDTRVRLLQRDNLDADPNFEKRVINWESLSAGYNKTYGNSEAWRGLAWLQVYGKASDQLNGIPTITGEYDTLIVPTPPITVYDPLLRTYTGATWDGSWVQRYTNDPAWCINGILQEPLRGLSSVAQNAHLNKWDAMAASKWFSEKVPDGNGGLEPRYSLNLATNQPQKAKEFIQNLAGAVGSIAWEGNNGEWHLRVDKPETPVDIFTLENVIGEFRYTHSDIETRFNDITGVFLNKEFGYVEDRVRVVSNVAIAKYGRKPTTIALMGCTGRQEALRRAIMRLRVANNETRTVKFVTNRRGRLLQRLDTILVADADLNHVLEEDNHLTSGRIVAVAPDRSWVEVRDPIRLELGASYDLTFTRFNPEYNPEITVDPSGLEWLKPTVIAKINVTNTDTQRGDVTRLYLETPLPANVPENANVALGAIGLPALPKAYRVLEVGLGDGEEIAVTALEIDSGKWAASDSGVVEEEMEGILEENVPAPLMPVSGPFLSYYLITGDYKQQIQLVANWQRPPSRFLSGFKVEYSVNGGPYIVAHDNLSTTTFELMNPTEGSYDFRIYSRDRFDRLSAPLEGSINVPSINLLLWENISGAGKPEDAATFGAPAGTLVAGVPATQVASATTNFNTLNDFNSTPVAAPTIPAAGVAIDHVGSTDGSVSISFEWNWTGTEGLIDGFQVYTYQGSGSGEYNFGTTPAEEVVYTIPANKRAFVLFGVQANKYYTFGVRAYRKVDETVAATGVIASAVVKSTVVGENPYLPAASVAFQGNIVGTVNGTSAEAVANGAISANEGLYLDGIVRPGKVTTPAITANGVTVPWLVSSSTYVAPPEATKTLVLSLTVTKEETVSLLEVHGQLPMYGSDAVKINMIYEVYSGASMVASRTFRLEVDANNKTYLPFAYEHYFNTLSAGVYDARMYIQRLTGHTCNTAGEYHMRVREFKK